MNIDEKSTKNVKIKKIIEKNFSKKKKDLNTIFEIVNVKNLITRTFMIYHIDNTIIISNIITKFFFKFENFLKKADATQTKMKKKKFKKRKEKKFREKDNKQTDN